MAIVVGLVALVILIIVGIIAFSFFGDAFDDFNKAIDEQNEKQSDTGDPDPTKIGNTGPVTCDLEVRFLGAIENKDIHNVLNFEDDLYLYLGDIGSPILNLPVYSSDVQNYQWHCSSDDFLSALSWQAQKLQLNAIDQFLGDSAGETIRIKFEGRARDGPGIMSGVPSNSKTGESVTVFQNSQRLPFDEPFPLALDLTIIVDDVVHDDYDILFWSDTEQMGVDGPIGVKGKKYHEVICGLDFNPSTGKLTGKSNC